jgi:sensor domain CHASE-containing protein
MLTGDELMTLRKRVLVNVSATIVALIALLFVIFRFVIMASFAELENENILQNVRRVLNVLEDDITTLDSTTFDWADWADWAA